MVARYRHVYAGAVWQVEERLHGALAEGFHSDYRPALVVLYRAREYLGGAGASLVDEHDERRVVRKARLRVERVVRALEAALHADDHSVAYEARGDVDAYVEQAAGVVTEVHDYALRVFRRRRLKRGAQLLVGL